MNELPEELITKIDDYSKSYSQYIANLQKPTVDTIKCDKIYDEIIKMVSEITQTSYILQSYNYTIECKKFNMDVHIYLRNKFHLANFDYEVDHDRKMITNHKLITISWQNTKYWPNINKIPKRMYEPYIINQGNDLYCKIIKYIKYYAIKNKDKNVIGYHYLWNDNAQLIYEYIHNKLDSEGFNIRCNEIYSLSNIIHPRMYDIDHFADQIEYEHIKQFGEYADSKMYAVIYVKWSDT